MRRLTGAAIVSPIPRTSHMRPKGCLLREIVTLFVVATFLPAACVLFGAPAVAGEVPDSFSIETFSVGSTPLGIAFDGANIWTTDFFGNAVIKVRASDGVILGSYSIFEPWSVACDGASVWIGNSVGIVTKIRGSDLTHEATIQISTSQLTGMIFDGTSIWVTIWGSVFVDKLSLDGAIVGSHWVGQGPYQLAFDGANVWTANQTSGTVTKLRASDGQVLFTVPAGSYPHGIVFDGHEIWIANENAGALTKLRLTDGAILGTARVGHNPQQLAFDGVSIWVTNYYPNNTVMKLRPRDGVRQHAFGTGTDPEGILFDGTSIWVTNYGSGTISKITHTSP